MLAGCGGDRSPATAPEPDYAALAEAESRLKQREEELADLRSEVRAHRVRNEQGERAIDGSTATTARRLLSQADARSFRRLTSALRGQHGVAVSRTGAGQPVQRLGTIRTAVAWSTAKVPVAMAVIAAGGATRRAGDLARAITASDNAAALRLWESLGGAQAAAAAATQQLRSAGDRATVIESRPLRGSSFTPFGQTAWTLTDQARFVAGMTCSPPGAQVLALMGQVVSGQRWGLASADGGARFKGGWGPGSRPGMGGGYLDRQMGVITVRGRQLAVAIATLPPDGSHETGIRNLTAIARWLVGHIDTRAEARKDSTRCPGQSTTR